MCWRKRHVEAKHYRCRSHCRGRSGCPHRANAEGVQHPDWSGQWERFVVPGLPGQPSHDQTKPWGFGQQAPLTPEYRKVLEDSIADQATGGLGNFPTAWGRAAGMPYMMMAFGTAGVGDHTEDNLHFNRL